MGFALKYGSVEQAGTESGLIYFDAVTQYSRDFSVQVSSHPLANGTQITDHSIRQNPKFNISAVISGVDITTWTTLVRDAEGVQPYNSYSNSPVSIEGNDSAFGWIPDTIGQFFEREEPIIYMDESRTDYTPQVEQSLISLMEGFVYDEATNHWRTNVQLVTLYELEGLMRKKEISDLVITGLRFQKDPKSGDALFFTMSLEKVTYKFLERVKLDQRITSEFKGMASEEEKKSNADSTVGDGNDPSDPNFGTRVEQWNKDMRNKFDIPETPNGGAN